MIDTTTTMVTTLEVREYIMGIIAQELGNRKRHVDGDQGVVLPNSNDIDIRQPSPTLVGS